MTPPVEEVVASAFRVPATSEQTFFDLLTALHHDEYTGILVLHLAQGVPKVAEIPERVITGRQVRLR